MVQCTIYSVYYTLYKCMYNYTTYTNILECIMYINEHIYYIMYYVYEYISLFAKKTRNNTKEIDNEVKKTHKC